MLLNCTLPRSARPLQQRQGRRGAAVVAQAQPTKEKAGKQDPATVGGLGKLQVGRAAVHVLV